MRQKIKAYYLLNIVFPLIIGTLIYILFRKNTYINNFVLNVLNIELPFLTAPRYLQHFLVCWASDALWAYALTFALYISLSDFRRAPEASSAIALVFITAIEFSRYFHIFGGTFDFWDIILEFASVFTAYSIIKRSNKKMKKITSILCALLVLATFTFFALGSGEDSSEVTPGDGTTASADANKTKELVVKVGEVLTTNTLKITYASCEDYTGYSEYSAPKAGNKIVKLTFDIENIGTVDETITSWSFNCYADDVDAKEYYGGDDTLSATLSAGRKASGSIYYEVPKDAEKIEVEYETSVWSGNKAIFVVK